MREADIPVVEDAARLLMAQVPAEQVGDMESLLALFVARYYDADLALAILRRITMNTDIIEQSPLYQQWRKQHLAEVAVLCQIIARGDDHAGRGAFRTPLRLTNHVNIL